MPDEILILALAAAAARQCGAKVSYVGSLYYEEMPCCGYDPQRRAFACPVKIKQNFGFGASPLPGSREYVLHCVAIPLAVGLLIAIPAGILLAVYLPGIDPVLIGPFRPAAYLTAYCYLVLPNAFAATSPHGRWSRAFSPRCNSSCS